MVQIFIYFLDYKKFIIEGICNTLCSDGCLSANADGIDHWARSTRPSETLSNAGALLVTTVTHIRLLYCGRQYAFYGLIASPTILVVCQMLLKHFQKIEYIASESTSV